ncbi:unnamed protein product, partial [Ixodes hexagonus]
VHGERAKDWPAERAGSERHHRPEESAARCCCLTSSLVSARAAPRDLRCPVSYCESTWYGDSWVIDGSQPLPLLTASHNRGPTTTAPDTRPAVAHGCSQTW